MWDYHSADLLSLEDYYFNFPWNDCCFLSSDTSSYEDIVIDFIILNGDILILVLCKIKTIG